MKGSLQQVGAIKKTGSPLHFENAGEPVFFIQIELVIARNQSLFAKYFRNWVRSNVLTPFSPFTFSFPLN